MHTFGALVPTMSPELEGVIVSLEIAGITCLLGAVCWLIVRKLTKSKQKLSYTFWVLAGSGIGLIGLVVVLVLASPPAPICQ